MFLVRIKFYGIYHQTHKHTKDHVGCCKKIRILTNLLMDNLDNSMFCFITFPFIFKDWSCFILFSKAQIILLCVLTWKMYKIYLRINIIFLFALFYFPPGLLIEYRQKPSSSSKQTFIKTKTFLLEKETPRVSNQKHSVNHKFCRLYFTRQ